MGHYGFWWKIFLRFRTAVVNVLPIHDVLLFSFLELMFLGN